MAHPGPSRVAVVTGASSGIGRASAVELSHAGWNVVLVGRNAQALTDTVLLCSTNVGNLKCYGDVADEAFVLSVFQETVARFGRVDLLFNNAGVSAPQVPIDELTLDQFSTVVNTNLIGSFLFTREAMRIFKRQMPPGGRIINNGSLSAHVPRPFSAPYAASKHAITGLTKSIALEGRAYNITCTQIDIGNAATALSLGMAVGPSPMSPTPFSGGGITPMRGHSLTPKINALQPSGITSHEPTIDVQHVARTVVNIAQLPLEVTVLEINIMATGMPYIGRG